MLLRRAFFIAAVALLSSALGISQTAQQTAPNQSTATTPPPPAAASQSPEQPQKEMPPDTKAPAPVPSAKPQSDSIPTSTTENSQPQILKAGTEFRATLDTPLSTKTSKVGDRFTATISAPVRGAIGNVIIPTGAKLNGQVSDSDNEKLDDAIKDMGHLNLRFTDIQLPNGTDVPIDATLISVHRTKPAARAENTAPAMGTNAGLTGAFGPPLKGLAVGNLAGGGYVLATTGKQVNLPAECGLRLRVDRNTPVP
ncbi:MAG TPA: hypothetical protein VFU50_08030 [Terriglobales bacterium]|nr:hypothetical protein [Terriglobales bacterium]